MVATTSSQARLLPVSFDDLDGWRDDRLASALAAFRKGADVLADHPPKSRGLGVDATALAKSLQRAARLPADLSDRAAREFFEVAFAPHEVAPATGRRLFTTSYAP